MADYIDRKKLQKELNDWYDYHYPTASGETDKLHMDINIIVRNIPPVDAVEVVRCKDCKYCGKSGPLYYCRKLQMYVNNDDYCKWGEKE